MSCRQCLGGSVLISRQDHLPDVCLSESCSTPELQLTLCPQPYYFAGEMRKRLEVLRKGRCDTKVKCCCNERGQGPRSDPPSPGWHSEDHGAEPWGLCGVGILWGVRTTVKSGHRPTSAPFTSTLSFLYQRERFWEVCCVNQT